MQFKKLLAWWTISDCCTAFSKRQIAFWPMLQIQSLDHLLNMPKKPWLTECHKYSKSTWSVFQTRATSSTLMLYNGSSLPPLTDGLCMSLSSKDIRKSMDRLLIKLVDILESGRVLRSCIFSWEDILTTVRLIKSCSKKDTLALRC